MENLENKNEIIVEENQVLPTEEVEENLSWWDKLIKAIKDFFAKIAALFGG